MNRCAFGCGVGLSPRVRGNRLYEVQNFLGERSIPACAGEPTGDVIKEPAGKVYPRVCGGTSEVASLYTLKVGLSPRVRGNLLGAKDIHTEEGSIPACAGEPIAIALSYLARRVYPRVCGGTDPRTSVTDFGVGLSPRVRGNQCGPILQASEGGSIPACAGEPRAYDLNQPQEPVYPRVCGGTFLNSPTSIRLSGLSPRVRGNPMLRTSPYSSVGSIPACAGEPAIRSSTLLNNAVYPRVCGGTRLWDTPAVPSLGLSPRVRGNHSPATTTEERAGSIPACAGEPVTFPNSAVTFRVYPRVCGGTSLWRAKCWGCSGLSPRVRGNPSYATTPTTGVRSIPACAGEPRSSGRPP